MKKDNGIENKHSKLKELYEQMQAEKEKTLAQQHKPGKKNRGVNGLKFNSQPRSVAKKYWRQ